MVVVAIDVIVEHLTVIISTGESFDVTTSIRRRRQSTPSDSGKPTERTRKLSESGSRPH